VSADMLASIAVLALLTSVAPAPFDNLMLSREDATRQRAALEELARDEHVEIVLRTYRYEPAASPVPIVPTVWMAPSATAGSDDGAPYSWASSVSAVASVQAYPITIVLDACQMHLPLLLLMTNAMILSLLLCACRQASNVSDVVHAEGVPVAAHLSDGCTKDQTASV
jgi:hypothetical protein